MELICESCRQYWNVSANNNVNALYQAICYQHVECVTVLVEIGTDMNHKINGLMTLLEIAVRNGKVEIVKVLTDAGADVNTATTESMLVIAVRYGHTAVVKALIDAGANVNPSFLNGRNPLPAAVLYKKTECLKMLIDAGADVNEKNNKVAWEIAAGCGDHQCMSLLIGAGADVNHRDDTGKSALCLAAFNYDTKCIELLIKNGAHVFKDVEPHQWLPNRYYYQRVVKAGDSMQKPHYHQKVDKSLWILFAAGVDTYIHTSGPEEVMRLKHLCRQCVRKHLLQMSPVNLFVQVLQLGLPTLLQKYLLYNVSLDDDEI